MATAKQIAARKLFAQRAKAGTLRKNPTKRKPAAKKAAPRKAAKKSVSKPSQITKRAPTKRLKARRAANSKPGYFPNPVPRTVNLKYKVQYLVGGVWKTVANFDTKPAAVQYGTALAKLYPARQYRVEF